MDKGQTAYAGYCEATGGKSPTTGEDYLPFEKLPKEVKDGWAAAETAAQELLKPQFKEMADAVDKLKEQNTTLMGELEVARAANRGLQETKATKLVHPSVGDSVTFVNHAGQPEHAVVTGHGITGVHLKIQGGHVNDKYTREEVPQGGPGQRLTYY